MRKVEEEIQIALEDAILIALKMKVSVYELRDAGSLYTMIFNLPNAATL